MIVIGTSIHFTFPISIRYGIDIGMKKNGIPTDTTLEAVRKEFEILRRLGPEVRAKMALEMSDNLRRIVKAGVRHRHPDFNQRKIELEVLRLMIGDKLYKQMIKDIETL